jgi:Ser/Thr protein kinase RdoA (MazF antagonist)
MMVATQVGDRVVAVDAIREESDEESSHSMNGSSATQLDKRRWPEWQIACASGCPGHPASKQREHNKSCNKPGRMLATLRRTVASRDFLSRIR